MNKEQYEEFCKMQVQWWIASATTGHAASRAITKGDGTELTYQEKIDSAMNTARQHLQNYWNSTNEIQS